MAFEYYPKNGQGVAVAIESTFGTASITESDYQIIAPKSLEGEAKCDIIDPEYSRDDMMMSPQIVGREMPTAKFALNIRGGATAPAAASSSTIYPELSAPLKCCLGAPVSDVSSVIVSGNTLQAEVTNASDFAVGSIGLVDPTGTGAYVPRLFTDLDTKTVQWTDATTSCTTDGKIYAGICYKAAFDIGYSMSMQVNTVKMSTKTHCTMLTGLMGKVTVEAAEAGKELLFNFDLQGDGFAEQEDTTNIIVPTTNPYPAAAYRPNVLLARNAVLLLNGTDTPVAKFSFDPGYEIAENQDHGGAQGRGIWKVTAQKPTFNITIPFEYAYRAAYTAGTILRVVYAIPNPANGFAVATEAAQITEITQSDINGVKAMDLKLSCVRPETSATVDVTLPAWSMALFGKQYTP